MPEESNKKEIDIAKNAIEEIMVNNPFKITEYSSQSRIFIFSLDAIEKYEPDTWSINREFFEMKNEPYVKLVGEFCYCGQLQDGKILYPLSEFKEFMETVKPSVRAIENNVLYFKNPLSKRTFNKIADLEILVQHIGTEFGNQEDDEIYLKISVHHENYR